MHKLLLVAGFAVAALAPSLALAQPSCGQQRDNQVGATVAGGALGAVVGSAIAPRGDRTAGAVVGGVGGAVIGNQIDRPDADCAHAYGYYDRSGQWHVNHIDRANARGYYDRNGAWVDGAPNGYYDRSGRWIVTTDTSTSGYYDSSGRWVSGVQPGYNDSSRRWHARPAQGYYDSRGVWIGSGPTVANGVDASYVGAGERQRDSDQYTGRVGSHWVDGYGRRCAWREVTYRDDDGYQAFKWVTDCRE